MNSTLSKPANILKEKSFEEERHEHIENSKVSLQRECWWQVLDTIMLFCCYPPLTESNDYKMNHEVNATFCCSCIYTDHDSMINVGFLSDYHLEYIL